MIIAALRRYEGNLAGILSRFTHTSDGIYISHGDDPLFRQYVQELVDLFNDVLGDNVYSAQIVGEFNEGVTNYIDSPSYKSVENILSLIRASSTRLTRNPSLMARKKSEEVLCRRENVFVIHGRDEAKWRELKDILKSEFRLNPIVLLEQPDAGCKTVIEKFEYYAKTCSYAIAVFTPDDEVSSEKEVYLQARPNVIYELGWFCGRLDRSGAMLLLKEGTSVFTDFGGIIQKRFANNISEKILEIKKDLVAAGVLDTI
ncbi:MAG: nucleotide-binding protein [Trichlorobacter sp.]|uniref:nucleotide-binding protein n=1 Tax=Trichlorobacter sp. TaxID=2911007 RepID=UPI0025642BBD|nr:nucleotide-binding protein [Trichlorobacter sp.]MDK9718811.1 nucleotide-binding protein [Trichlorobacter sp.]